MNEGLYSRATRELGDLRNWFTGRYKDHAQVRVLISPPGADKLYTSATVNRSEVVEGTDGSLTFKLYITIDGAERVFTSDRPDHFDEVELTGL